MKRLFVLFVSFILLAAPVFAGNTLQRDFEIKFITSNSIFTSTNTKELLKDDYSHYLNGGGSLYGVLKYQDEALSKNLSADNKTNLLYVQKMIKDYDCFYNFHDKKYCSINFYIVDDATYNKFNNPVKQVMGALNYIFNH